MLIGLACNGYLYAGFDHIRAYNQTDLMKKFPNLDAAINKAIQEGIISPELEQFQNATSSYFRKNLLKEMIITALKDASLTWGCTLVYGVYYFYRAKSREQTVAHSMLNEDYFGVPLPISAMGLLGGIAAPIVRYVPALWKTYLETSEFDKRMGEAEKKYLCIKVFYSKSLQRIIERALGFARLGNVSGNIDFVEEVLKLPILNKSIPFSSQNLKKFTDDVLSGYEGGEEFVNAIKLLCFDRAQLKGSHRKGLVYFYGKPGTGKTYLAHKIAQFLNLEIAEVPLANATVERLSGTKRRGAHASEGRILQALCNPSGITDSKQNSANMILFFDEAEKVLNENNSLSSYMLKILDPHQKTFFSPYFNSNINISNLLIILCGNEPIKMRALKNRMQNIEFKGFKPSYRKTAIKDYIMELPSHEKLSNSDFYKVNQVNINKLVDAETDPGLRVLHRAVRNLYNKNILERYESQATSSASSSSDLSNSEPVQNGSSKLPKSLNQKKTQ